MSMKGRVEAQCPNGCAPFETEVWSLVRFDRDPQLKDQLMAGELNLLACGNCHRHFYFDHTLVFHDPRTELLAFVFPADYRGESEAWRKKMEADYRTMQEGLGKLKLDYPPILMFGLEELRALLEKEENLSDEMEIAKHLARRLKLQLYKVKPSVARERDIPTFLPCLDAGGDIRPRVLRGLEKLLGENGYLAHYKALLEQLRGRPEDPLPPAAHS